MTILQNGFLGRLVFDADGVADTTLPMRDREVDIDVWFDGDPDPDLLDRSAAVLADLESLDAVCRAAIAADQQAFAAYYEHHLEELPATDLLRCCGVADRAAVTSEGFMAALCFEKVDLYPDSEEELLNCDYTIGDSLTDYVLSVSLGRDGEVAEVAMES